MNIHHDATDQSAVWVTIVVILLLVISILLVGYFAWWAPTHSETTIIQIPERNREVAVTR